jgi:hypothetical protein
MVKLDPEKLRQISEEIDGIVNGHRDVLDHNPQISRPLSQARDAARAKYKNITPNEQTGRERRDQCDCIFCRSPRKSL